MVIVKVLSGVSEKSRVPLDEWHARVSPGVEGEKSEEMVDEKFHSAKEQRRGGDFSILLRRQVRQREGVPESICVWDR